MKKLVKLAAVVGLSLSFGLVALGGETQGPPCPPPDPGETQGPPCSSVQPTSDDDSQTELQTAQASDSIDYVTEVTLALVQSVMSLL
jgi:hypothetical protein